ncbi:hypothetical protein [Pelagicoccus sp. SDUM812002]|uniref:WD40/YVTN/BNR-like repeat-containing protein n=1 Tax=Pelagicoccus sp. SDUM812002 TaxID=3041266 RepID=UPI00280E6B5A|nr:hypothetical protein [Pelagicoccus sp. SDUM812002]MDQ8186508.1 hypothetical protein [Pelagicoccus sp. SDUM812002]
MIRPAKDFLRFALAVFAALLGFMPFAVGEVSFLNRGLVDVEVAGDVLLAISTDGELLRSTNDGSSFSVSFTSDPFEKPQALAASGQVVIAVCEGGVVLRSGDAGVTWGEASFPLSFATLTSAATNGAGTWIAAGQSTGKGYLLRSTDNGVNWSSVAFSQEGSIETIDYDTTATTWMLGGWKLSGGRTGIAFRSTNGTSWSEVTLPAETTSVSAITANGAGQFGMVGANGFLAVLATDGSVIASDSQTFSETLTAIDFSSAGDWIAGGMENLLIRFALAGEELTTSVAQASLPGAPEVAAISEDASGRLFVASEVGFEASVPDPKVRIDLTDGELVITATGLGLGREYSLLKSTDLLAFEEVPDSSFVATSGTTRWIVSQELAETTPVFWKLAEN